jgi:hypothetical protein
MTDNSKWNVPFFTGLFVGVSFTLGILGFFLK